MKKAATLLVLLAFAGQTFSQAIIILQFYLNRSYIASTQCENRYKPMLHCNGKCVLCKKLNQQEKKDQQSPERKADIKTQTISSRSFFAEAGLLMISSIQSNYKSYRDSQPIDRSFPVFHPPRY